VRTEKSAWLRYTSIRIGGGGVYLYVDAKRAYAASASSATYGCSSADSSFSIMKTK